MHQRELKAASEAEQKIVAAQKSLEQHRVKNGDIEKTLQERRNHLEHPHRQVAADASHGTEATQLDVMFKTVSQALASRGEGQLQKGADLYEEERKAQAAAREAAARPAKEGMEIDEFGGLDDQEDPTAEARIHASIDERLQAQTKGDPVEEAEARAASAPDGRSRSPSLNQWELLDYAQRVDGSSGAPASGAGAGAPAGSRQM